MNETDKKEIQSAVGEAIKESPFIKDQIDAAMKATLADVKKSFVPDPNIEAATKDTLKFKSFGEQLQSIFAFRNSGGRDRDNRLAFLDKNGKIQNLDNVKALTEGTDSQGGFLVFPKYDSDIKFVALEQSVIRPNGASIIPMATDVFNMPRINDTSHVSNVYGGFVGYWGAEGGTINEADIKWGTCMLTAHKMSFFTRASNELLQDNAVGLEAFLRPRAAEALAWFEDVAFIQGAGGGQPLGILNAPCLISVTRQNTSRVVVKDLYNIYGQILPASRDKFAWIMNHEVLTDLLYTIAENAPAVYGSTPAYSATPVFQKSIIDPVAKTILGRPYFVTEKMSALGDAGDIGAFDLSYFLIGDRQPLTVDASSLVYFTSDYTAWRFKERLDAQPWLASAITPFKGSHTLSPFVALGATS